MNIRYFKITGYYDDEEECDDFDYEVAWEDEVVALTEFIYEDYFVFDKTKKSKSYKDFVKNGIRNMLENMNNEEISRYEEDYYDRLYDWFVSDAFERQTEFE